MSSEYRPSTFAEVVGQQETIKRLKIQIASAKQRNTALNHILFEGEPGLGKTTLAQAIANELGVYVLTTNATNLSTLKKITPAVTKVGDQRCSILFIDEIHNLPKKVSEFLYPVMEDFRMDVSTEDFSDSIELLPFTVIGATTEAGFLPQPLQARFVSKYTLKPYSVEELTWIIERKATKISMEIDLEACQEIARRSKGVARLAGNHLSWVRDYAIAEGTGIDKQLVIDAMKMSGVDEYGLDENDRKILAVLADETAPIGINVLASKTGIHEKTIAENIEPYMIRKNLMSRHSRGREGNRPKIREILSVKLSENQKVMV